MYYEERIINGVLCYRYLPDAEFKPFTQSQLTDRIKRLERELESVKSGIEEDSCK